MRRPVHLASSLAVGLGALLVAGPIAAPALAGHASMTAASPHRNGNDHAHSTAKAWKTREWVSERRLAESCAKVTKALKKGSVRRPAQQCATVSPGSVVRAVPVLRQTAQPTTTAGPPTTRAPTPPTYQPDPGDQPPPRPAGPTTTTPPTTTICEPTTGSGGGQLPSTGSSPAHLLIAGLLLGGGGLTILVGVRSSATQRGAK
jgi:LPXTG-motif cell wall-anchored protein